MVYAGGHLSGGHLNPAVSTALFLRGSFSPEDSPFQKPVIDYSLYMCTQVVAGFVAGGVAFAVTTDGNGYPSIGDDYKTWQALVVEIVLTNALCTVVLNSATTAASANNSYFGLAIGFTVLSGALSVGDISGGAFNPAVGMLSLIRSGDHRQDVWIYILGPFIGAVIAAAMFHITNFKERNPGEESAIAKHIAPLLFEFYGTFMLCFTIAMAARSYPSSHDTSLAPLSIGSMLMAMVYAGGHVSGGEYNPAVTVALLIRFRGIAQEVNPAVKTLSYIIIQIMGGFTAAGLAYSIQQKDIGFPDYDNTKYYDALVSEFLFTFALCHSVLNSATVTGTAANSYFGLTIGFTVVAGAVTVGSISGGAFNPAVATTLPVVAGDACHIWVYWTGEIVAAVAAALLFRFANIDEFAATRGRKYSAHMEGTETRGRSNTYNIHHGPEHSTTYSAPEPFENDEGRS